MSARSSRNAAALLRGIESGAALAKEEPQETEEKAGLSGNWSRQAMRGYKDRLQDAQEEAARANRTVYEGVLDGVVPVKIPAIDIDDELGTDRIASAADETGEESLESLVENIRARGLRVPLRVRPVDPSWRPPEAFPRDVSGQRFVLQSGRRRLEACRQLGITPLCFLSFPEGDSAPIEDLQERFFENTVRKNLNTYERLYSIGLIAQKSGDTSMRQIGEIIGVSKADVSRGRAVVEFAEELVQHLDPATATRDSIDTALKKIREKHRTLSDDKEAERSRARRAQARAPALPFRKKELPIGVVKLRTARDGRRVMTLESDGLDDVRIEKLVKFLNRL